MSRIKSIYLISIVLLLSCAHRNDREIETDVSVNVHPTAPDITVSVTNGIALLSGLVKDSASWRATMEAARSTKGVISVTNQLHVANPRPAN